MTYALLFIVLYLIAGAAFGFRRITEQFAYYKTGSDGISIGIGPLGVVALVWIVICLL